MVIYPITLPFAGYVCLSASWSSPAAALSIDVYVGNEFYFNTTSLN